MKKYIGLTLALLFVMSITSHAQRLFDDEGDDAQGFILSFVFQHKESNPVTIMITDDYGSARDNQNNYGAQLRLNGTGCDFENNWQIPIVGRYSYDQLRQYLVDIDIRTFKPSIAAEPTDLRVRVSFMSRNNQRNVNTFDWNYNADNIGDETQILTYLLEVLNDNVFIQCAEDYVELLETYIEGE